MKKIIIIVGGVIIVAICGIVYWRFEASLHNVNTPSQPVALRAVRLVQQNVTLVKELPGRTQAFKIAEIRPQVSGIIIQRSFAEGSYVNEGDQLYQIDPLTYQAAYDSAAANLQKSEANLLSIQARHKRYSKLVKVEAISKQDYDDIVASLATAQADTSIATAALKQAKLNLDYTKVFAPISGIISKSHITEGALVTAAQSDPIATITLLDPMYVDMLPSSETIVQLESVEKNYSNIPATLLIGNNQQVYPSKGQIQFHEVNVDQTTGALLLRALFPNPDKTLFSGLFVRVKLELNYPKAILIPQYATMRQPDGSLSVWKLNTEGQAQPTPITANNAVNGNWLVLSGVTEGDIIITEGLISLRPGTNVNPILENVVLLNNKS